jgi:hypothetical protein
MLNADLLVGCMVTVYEFCVEGPPGITEFYPGLNMMCTNGP